MLEKKQKKNRTSEKMLEKRQKKVENTNLATTTLTTTHM